MANKTLNPIYSALRGSRPFRRRVVGIVAALSLPIAAAMTISSAPASFADQTTARHASANGAHNSRLTPRHTVFGTSLYQGGGASLHQALLREQAKYGKLRIVRLFFSGMPGSWSTIQSAIGDKPLIVSFKAQPADVLSGSLDSQFLNWFETAPTDVRIRWSYWHEPEDDIAAGRFTAAQYTAAWAHLRALADEADNPKLRATLILMCWTLQPASGRDWQDYYNADAVQVLGFDCYNAGAKNDKYESGADMFSRILTVAEQTGKPWGIAEMGSVLIQGDSGSGRAAWLQQMAGYVHAHGGRFITYFDSPVGGVDFRLEDNPSTRAWSSEVDS